MLKKCVAILMVAAMLLGGLPMVVGAAEAADPHNFMANVANGNLTVSWRNAKTSDAAITGITLYDITDGAETVIDGTWDTALGAYNKIALTGQTAGKTYTYRLVTAYEGGTTSTVEASETNTAYAADMISGWTTIHAGGGIVAKASVKAVADADGNNTHALHLQGNQNGTIGETYIKMIQNSSFTPKADTYYRVKIDFKANYLDCLSILTGEGWAYQTIVGHKNYDGTDYTDAGTVGQWGRYIDTGSWTTYQEDLVLYHASVSTVGFNFGGSMNADCYVDNVEVYELDAAGGSVISDNLIVNGDFEADYEVKPNPAPRNFFTNAAGENLMVSWRNPKAANASADITGIKLYNTTSGSDVEVAGEWDTAFDAFNRVSLSGLTANETYSFKLVVSYASGDPVTAEISEKFEIPQMEGWTVINSGSAINAKASVKSVEGADGSSTHALHLQGNQNAVLDNTFMQIMQDNTTTVKADTNYLVKMKLKADYLDRLFLMSGLGWAYNDVIGARRYDGTDGQDAGAAGMWGYYIDTGSWVTYERTLQLYQAAANGGVGLNLGAYMNADCYIDDIEVYELDSSGAVVGENIITNGDFEAGFEVKPNPAPRNFFTNAAGENLMVSWRNPASGDAAITGIKLYNTTSGSDVEIAGEWDTTFDAFNKIALSGMIPNATYSFKLVYTYASGDPVTAEITEVFEAQPQIEGWNVFASGSDIVAKATVRSIADANGETTHALHIQGNQNGQLDNTFLQFVNTNATAKKDVTYRVKMDVKADYLTRLFIMTGAGHQYNTILLTEYEQWRYQVPVGEWHTYQDSFVIFHDYTPDTAGNIGFNFGGEMNGDFYIDNIEVYKLDADGNIASDNLIVNGDFETAPAYQTGSIVKIGDEVTVSVRNNAMGAAFAPYLLVALYDGDMLKEVYMDTETVAPAATYDAPMTELSVTAANPNNYEVRAFLWGGTDSITPLLTDVTF